MTAQVLIIGDTPWGRRIGAELAAHDIESTLLSNGPATPSAGVARVLDNAGIVSCRGAVGDFTLAIQRDGESITHRAGAVVVAEGGRRIAHFDRYGLTPGPNVVALSEGVRDAFPGGRPADGGAAVFLHGLVGDSTPAIAEAVMDAAVELAETHGITPYILTGNLKVARNGLERRYRAARRAGAVFVKFTRDLPRIVQDGPEIRITFTDEVTRKAFKLSPDLTVVDETVAPPDRLPALARVLGLSMGPDGFLQADNVRRLGVFTNRKGIFAVGPARSPEGAADPMADADSAVIAVRAALEGRVPRPDHQAEINENMCVRCLTCYRTCPYRAVGLYPDHLAVLPDACEGCGICAAECPREAIRFAPFDLSDIADRLAAARRDLSSRSPDAPFIAAFLCQRSASQARAAAEARGWRAPEGLFCIDVPCAGTVSADHLFSAFHKGADGVLVITCHPDNCHSETGNLRARQRTQGVADLLDRTGGPADRVRVESLAANMGAAFSRIVDDFNRFIADRGATRPDR